MRWWICILIGMPLMAFAQPDGFETTGNRLYYQLHSHTEEARKAKPGDLATVHLSYRTENDSVLFDSHRTGKPVRLKIKTPEYKGDIHEGYAMLSVGDSATFATSANLFFGKSLHRNRPSWIRSGSYLFFEVKVLKIQTAAEVQAEAQALKAEKKATEAQRIQDFLTQQSISVEPTASGLYYQETTKGIGPRVYNGKVVRVHYVGRLLDGRVFDSSRKTGRTFQFTVGKGDVVSGWDEALLLMKVGTKARLILPSRLGYGSLGAPGSIIGPYEPLVFEIELISIE